MSGRSELDRIFEDPAVVNISISREHGKAPGDETYYVRVMRYPTTNDGEVIHINGIERIGKYTGKNRAWTILTAHANSKGNDAPPMPSSSVGRGEGTSDEQ